MFETIKKLIKYPRLTQNYPKKAFDSSWANGRPEIDVKKCLRCGECVLRCPSHAIVLEKATNDIEINYDECVFCNLCVEVCTFGAAEVSSKIELAISCEIIKTELKKKIKKTFGRSLQIREVNAGSCNACDYEINALNNPFNDIERLGINFVASPRHADMLLVTGTGTRNMELALVKTYNATPDPKLVVAVGACACSGGIFKGNYATKNGIDCIIPVDVYIPGCPPRPQAIIYGILKALDKV